ncbi:MAG TPA: DUF72 domain-containing protein [Caulobacteraceae bacterium]|nr:DUF72 domain-containing protein [Caulobacteraceae bacterium]
MVTPGVRIGTAGWSIPRAAAGRFPPQGSGLERYAAVFDAVEINSTFYRSHRPATFARWAERTPAGFAFSVKLPRAITHEARLVEAAGLFGRFLSELEPLRAKLAVLLVQLPPSLAFDAAVARAFFDAARQQEPGLPIVCEPRHASWFSPEADALLADFRIARVAADPALVPPAGEPGGWPGLGYFRLHGSPRMYRSAYGPGAVARLAERLRRLPAGEAWCIFDNTASGAAAADALDLAERLARPAARAITPCRPSPGC